MECIATNTKRIQFRWSNAFWNAWKLIFKWHGSGTMAHIIILHTQRQTKCDIFKWYENYRERQQIMTTNFNHNSLVWSTSIIRLCGGELLRNVDSTNENTQMSAIALSDVKKRSRSQWNVHWLTIYGVCMSISRRNGTIAVTMYGIRLPHTHT